MTTSAKPTRTRKPAEPVPGYTTASEMTKTKPAQGTPAEGRATSRTRGTAKIDPAPVVAKPTGNECRCGCGGQTGGTYRQGHDARHVSQLLAAVTAGDLTYLEAVRELPTPNLKVKLQHAHDRAQVKAQASRERQARKAGTTQATPATTDTQKEN